MYDCRSSFRWPCASALWAALVLAWCCFSAGVASGAQNTSQIQSLIQQGRAASAAGHLEEAFQLFKEAVRLNPRHPEAHFRLGVVYVRLNRYQEGVSHIQQAVALAPNNMGARMSLASLYERGGELAKARQEYLSIVEISKDPDVKEKARRRLARLRAVERRGRPQVADPVQQLESALAAQPQDLQLWIRLGEAYLVRKRYDDARRAFLRVSRLSPDNSVAHLRLAELAHREGENVVAKDHLVELLDELPAGSLGEAAIRLSIAVAGALKGSGDLRNAVRLLEAVAVVSPRDVSVLGNLGVIYRELGDVRLAELYFRQALDVDPDNALLHANLASLLVDTERPDDAIEELETVLRIGGDKDTATRQARRLLTDIFFQRGTAYARSGQGELAVEAYKRALEYTPTYLPALQSLGLVYFNTKRFQDARDIFERAREVSPLNAPVNFSLGKVYEELGMYDEALEAYGQAMAYGRGILDVTKVAHKIAFVVAKQSYETGKFVIAENIFREISKLNPNDELTHFYSALVFERSGRPEKAAEEYKAVIRLQPGHMGARFNLARIYEQLWMEEEAMAEYNIIIRSRIPSLVVEADRRRAALRKRINGFSYSLTQSLMLDDNVNLTRDDESFDYRTTVSYNATYRKRFEKSRFSFNLNPAYTGFIINGFDFLNLSAGPTYTIGRPEKGWDFSYNFSKQYSFLTEDEVSESHSLAAVMRRRLTVPSWFAPDPRQGSDYEPSWNLRARLGYRGYTSFGNDALSADNYSIRASLNMRYVRRRSWTLAYTLTQNQNTKTAGDDYAYRSHALSLSVDQALSTKWSGRLSYGYTLTNYLNEDSFSGFKVRRKNQRHALSASLNYRLQPGVRFFTNFAWTLNESNLPVGVALQGLDVVIQSNSLGDYESKTLNMGLAFTF
ncbi:MAG TPA: tetratricopeptide repeat protein [Gammaproteobacteria bacterium]|nr:tetratricopeptide repeat protein [Gammaproteobacteria bacterium]